MTDFNPNNGQTAATASPYASCILSFAPWEEPTTAGGIIPHMLLGSLARRLDACGACERPDATVDLFYRVINAAQRRRGATVPINTPGATFIPAQGYRGAVEEVVDVLAQWDDRMEMSGLVRFDDAGVYVSWVPTELVAAVSSEFGIDDPQISIVWEIGYAKDGQLFRTRWALDLDPRITEAIADPSARGKFRDLYGAWLTRTQEWAFGEWAMTELLCQEAEEEEETEDDDDGLPPPVDAVIRSHTIH